MNWIFRLLATRSQSERKINLRIQFLSYVSHILSTPWLEATRQRTELFCHCRKYYWTVLGSRQETCMSGWHHTKNESGGSIGEGSTRQAGVSVMR